MKIKYLLFVGAVFLGRSYTASAQQIPALKDTLLQEITISSSRVNAKVEDLPQKIVVISQEDIKQADPKDLTDALKKMAGVDVIEYPGLSSGIGIRGYRPQFSGLNQRSLVLIDGRPAGASNLATINLDNIERIEVIKGAASSLYGSQAMGGVVNLITKKSQGEIKKTITGSYGSYNTIEVGFNAGGSIDDKTDFDVNLNYFNQVDNYTYGSDNFFRERYGWNEVERTYYNAEHGVDSVLTGNDAFADGEERDFTKYKYFSGDIRFGVDINDDWRADVSGSMFSAHDVQSPGDFAYGNSSQSIKNPYRYGADVTVTGALTENHTLKAKAYSSLEYYDYRSVSNGELADFVTSKYTNSWKGFQLQDNFNWGNHVIAFGVDYSRANSESQSFSATTGDETAPYNPNYGIYSTALFGQGNFSFLEDRLHATLGVRLDHITFDVKDTEFLDSYTKGKESYNVFNPSAGLKYDIDDHFNIHGSAGRAFVTPVAYYVAGYSVSGTGAVNVSEGNPDLDPESGITIDGGIGYNNVKNGLALDATYFTTFVRDRITTKNVEVNGLEFTSEGDTIVSRTTYVNADKARMSGIELAASWDLGAYANYAYSLKLFANATKYFTTEDRFEGEDSYKSNIQNVADLSYNYGIDYSGETFNLRLAGRYVGHRFDTDWTDYAKRPEIEYAPFMVVDLTTGFKLSEQVALMFIVKNLTDENYYEKRGYTLAGRNMHMKLTLNF